jgi:cytoplasmic iron level regulating protein YaaA (DUF328/UPF0246 family)
MQIFLSPSKGMNASPPLPHTLSSREGQALLTELSASPPSVELSVRLVDALTRALGASDEERVVALQPLMKLSPSLALEVNHKLTAWRPEGGSLAALSYTGDTFQGLDAPSWSLEVWRRAQAHLWVLSGLYGALRPLHLIHTYRLEMGQRFKGALSEAVSGVFPSQPTPLSACTLAQLWRPELTRSLGPACEAQGEVSGAWVLNLASQEYSQCLNAESLGVQLCSPRFLDRPQKGDQTKSGDYKVVSKYAKRARGLMARYALSVGASSPADLVGFDLEGYRFDEAESQVSSGALTFKRDAR